MMEGDQRMVSTTTQRKKKMSKNSRRFNDEQIKSMETIFRVEAKLEPRKKLQMASELGLQPRQVAIWFQNKRARWKSKQIEQEYTSLKADYDELDSRFESLKKEKHSSLIQLQKLRDQLNTDGEGVGESKKVVLEGKSTDSCSENRDMKIQVKGKSSSLSGGVDEEMLMYSDEELDRRMNGYDIAEREGDEFQRLGAEKAGGFSELRAERIRGFDELDDGLFNQPCATPTWWDFWS